MRPKFNKLRTITSSFILSICYFSSVYAMDYPINWVDAQTTPDAVNPPNLNICNTVYYMYLDHLTTGNRIISGTHAVADDSGLAASGYLPFVITKTYPDDITCKWYNGIKVDISLLANQSLASPNQSLFPTNIRNLGFTRNVFQAVNRGACLLNNETVDGKKILLSISSNNTQAGALKAGNPAYTTFSFWEASSQSVDQTISDSYNICYIDSDNDGIYDWNDLCPLLGKGSDDLLTQRKWDDKTNTENSQTPPMFDNDSDGIGNRCDNCPDVANPDQADSNANGIGDACEVIPVPVTSSDTDCDQTNYTDNKLCDIVTDSEVTAIGGEPEFKTATVKLAVLPFKFSTNTASIAGNTRDCRLGKIIYNSQTILDCQQDPTNFACQAGCEVSPTASCFYEATFKLNPQTIIDASGTDYFNTPEQDIDLTFEVLINSDYNNTSDSSIGNFVANYNEASFATSSTSTNDSHNCSFGVKVKKQRALLQSVSCKLKLANKPEVENIGTLQDYIKAVVNYEQNCP